MNTCPRHGRCLWTTAIAGACLVGVALLTGCTPSARDVDRQAVTAMNRGVKLAKEQKYEEAVAQLKEALRLDPGLAEAHYHLGSVREALGEATKAIEDYTEAIRIKPDYADAFNERANVYYALGDTDRAIADFRPL